MKNAVLGSGTWSFAGDLLYRIDLVAPKRIVRGISDEGPDGFRGTSNYCGLCDVHDLCFPLISNSQLIFAVHISHVPNMSECLGKTVRQKRFDESDARVAKGPEMEAHSQTLPLQAMLDSALHFGLTEEEVRQAVSDAFRETDEDSAEPEYFDQLAATLARYILAKQRRILSERYEH
jgi:hypothetical protein